MRPEGQSGQYLGVQSSGALQNGVSSLSRCQLASDSGDLAEGGMPGAWRSRPGERVGCKKVSSLPGVWFWTCVTIDEDVDLIRGGECNIPQI